MTPGKRKERIERILSGHIRCDDLMLLYIFLRDNTKNKKGSVAEIGHFCAHSAERTKGVSLVAGQNWMTTTLYFMAALEHPKARARNPFSLPKIARDYFRIAHELIPHKVLRKNLSGSQNKLKDIGESVSASLIENENGTLSLPIGIGAEGWNYFKAVTSIFPSSPLFTGQQIGSEFISALMENSMIEKTLTKDEKGKLSTAAQLFTICLLHRRSLRTAGDISISLHASANGMLSVNASFRAIALPDGRELHIASPILTTLLAAGDYCESPSLETTWDSKSLDISQNGKILAVEGG